MERASIETYAPRPSKRLKLWQPVRLLEAAELSGTVCKVSWSVDPIIRRSAIIPVVGTEQGHPD